MMFFAFVAIGLAILLVAAFMAHTARRAIIEQREQVKEILAEMKAIQAEERAAAGGDKEAAATDQL